MKVELDTFCLAHLEGALGAAEIRMGLEIYSRFCTIMIHSGAPAIFHERPYYGRRDTRVVLDETLDDDEITWTKRG